MRRGVGVPNCRWRPLETKLLKRKQALVPVSEILADPPGAELAIRNAKPQAQYHYSLIDQVNHLVGTPVAHADCPPTLDSLWF